MAGFWPALVSFIGNLISNQAWQWVAARLIVTAAVSTYFARRAARFDQDLQQRAVTTRGTIEAQKRVYGEAQISGPLAYANVGGTSNRDLWQVVLLAGHECDSISDIWLDDRMIADADIDGGSAGGGDVGGSGTFRPRNGFTVARVTKYLGTSTQTADATLDAAVDRNGAPLGWTSDHRLRGICYIAVRLSYFKYSATVWERGDPINIRALVRGAKVYDPRLDSTNGGSGSHRYDDATTWAWSDNPALCFADYLMDTKFGLSIAPARIDWESITDSADYCDVLVDVPTSSTEKRFTCNGTVSGTADHKTNIQNILSSCNGKMTFSGGKYYLRVGYTAPVETLTDDDLAGPVNIRTKLERQKRVNQIRAIYTDPDLKYKTTETPPITTAAIDARDNEDELPEEITLPMTNSFFMAQRLAWGQLHQSNEELQLSADFNIRAARARAGTRVNLELSELSWSPKVFDVIDWQIVEEGESSLGIQLSLREDSAAAWSDPDEADYITRSAAGELDFGSRGIPVGDNLTAIAGLEAVLVEWDNPEDFDQWREVTLWASTDSSWSNANEIYTGRANAFVHTLPAGATRYYWITYVNHADDPTDPTDARFPDSDTSAVNATASAISTDDVDGLGTAAEQNGVFVQEDYADNNITAMQNRWPDTSGAGTETIESVGDWGYVYQVAGGERRRAYDQRYALRIVENRIYRVSAYVQRTVGAGDIYLGVTGYSGDVRNGNGTVEARTGTSAVSGQYYFAAQAYNPPDTGWWPVTGYFTKDGTAYSHNAGTFADPHILDPAVDYVVPLTIVNLPGVAGTTRVARVIVEEVVHAVGDATAGAIGGTIQGEGQLSDVAANDGGDNWRSIMHGLYYGVAFDGDAITFPETWGLTPTVRFLPGGLTQLAALSGDQYQDYRAQNVTTTGFDAHLRVSETVGSTTPRTDTTESAPSSPSGLDRSINKGQTGEAWDGNYTFQLDVEITNSFESEFGGYLPGRVTVGFYTNDGGGWVLRATEQYNGDGLSGTTTRNNVSKTINVSGLGLNDDFGVSVESTFFGGEITNFDSVSYSTATAPSDADATADTSGVPFIVMGG